MEKYINFFEELNKFKEKQQKQKERGLNDYNLLTTVLNEHDEVRLHSRVIGSLLDINGLHYQKELFLEKFVEILKITEFNFDIHESKLFLEYQNIDLYLTDGIKHIIIENKIYADDQKNQIKRYYEIIKGENKDLEYNDILIIYLSIDRLQPSNYSLGNLTIEDKYIFDNTEKIAIFKNINYKNEILNWLDNCLYEIQNITNLNESIQQYKNVVEKITNKYKEKVMSIKEFLLENNNLKLAMGLENSIKEAKIEIQLLFWEELYKQLTNNGHQFNFVDYKSNEIDINNKIKEYYYKNNKYYGLVRKLIDIDDKHSLIFYIEIDKDIVFGYSIAENGNRNYICKQNKFDDISRQIISYDNIKWNGIRPEWWICWKYPKNKLDFYRFDSDIIFDLIDEKKRIQIVANLVEEIILTINEIKVEN
ncbi:PD-(D/E)XK nuclease family protein [Aliarcobacter butzleri]|uniref:PDDEXK-like family protein n=1 Tax=Aliarcobacter butzleri TaxID=28197 RepID=UPI00125EA257|nr:PD-(D/E)XK nuclease family protein [Aliarcobacter butzleri]MCT7627690.1 PD-(D/E)XK nuclease family protein [Aliarcobacter butzleri]UWY60613.1 PD-(D/E)XK nuclease family protein [Aliarcobacter butzleri]